MAVVRRQRIGKRLDRTGSHGYVSGAEPVENLGRNAVSTPPKHRSDLPRQTLFIILDLDRGGR